MKHWFYSITWYWLYGGLHKIWILSIATRWFSETTKNSKANTHRMQSHTPKWNKIIERNWSNRVDSVFFLCLVLLYVCVRVFSLSLSTWISSQREAGVSCYYCTVDAIATRSLRFSVINFTAQLMLVHNLIDSLRTVSFVVLHSVPLVHKCT